MSFSHYENPVACAHMRVDTETRTWRAGKVLFFDDSFEHEVWNDCDDGTTVTDHNDTAGYTNLDQDGRSLASRAIFQLVIAHPELAELVRLGKVQDPFPSTRVLNLQDPLIRKEL